MKSEVNEQPTASHPESKPDHREEFPTPVNDQVETIKSSGAIRLLCLSSAIVVFAIYLLRLDRVIGLMGDDSWYVLLAKALATGQGYTLINSPTPGILPLYPPGFPFLLSLFYRLSPNFPDNLWLLKSVSMVGMFIVGIITYRYFLRDRGLPAAVALGISVATTVCPAIVFLATSTVMSDCIYMLFFVLTIFVTERCVAARGTSREWIYAVLSAALASYTYLVRSIAIVLIASVAIYLLKERLIRSAIIFSLLAAIFASPWMIYSRTHTPTPEQQLEQGGNMVLPYSAQFWQRLAGDTSQGDVSAKELPKRFLDNIIQITGRDIGRIMVNPVFEYFRNPYQEADEMIKEGHFRYGRAWWGSFILSAFVIIGFVIAASRKLTFAEIAIPIMLGIIIIWPFETFRYVLPLSPFLTYYFLIGIRSVQGVIKRSVAKEGAPVNWGLASAILIAVISLNLYKNIDRIVELQASSSLDGPIWSQKFEGVETTLKRLDKEAKPTDIIASTNPALINLYTGRKTVAWDNPPVRWENWKKLPVRYLVWIMVYPTPPHPAERWFRTVYNSNDGSQFRIVDFGNPESRPDWNVLTSSQ